MTSLDAPFVTVLMPVFNAGRFIAHSIDSVLRQEFSDYELLIVDDGSTDNSPEIIRSYSDKRIRLIQLAQNEGFVGALNKGLIEARAPWIARQDGDDYSRPERLREQVNLAIQYPDTDLVYSDAMLVNELGLFQGMLYAPENEVLLRWDLCFRNAIPHSSVLFQRDTVNRLGGYRRDNVSADYDLWTRLIENGHAQKCPGTLVHYRLHSRSIMGTENATQEKASVAPLQEIMRANLTHTFGSDVEDFQIILDAWTSDTDQDWPAYFRRREALLRKFSEKYGVQPGMPHLLARQDYTLFHRVLRRGRGHSLKFLNAMPWKYRQNLPKIAYSLLRG